VVGSEILDTQYDIQGRPVAYGNTVPSFVTWQDFLYAGDRFAGYYGAGTRFVHPDDLGSSTHTTDHTGAEIQDELYYPFGDRWQVYLLEDERFAGMQRRDSESGLDPTLNRMYTSSLGRWMTPDPMGGDVTNPQSLNRYAYVLNNPTTLTDPMGLQSRSTLNSLCTSPMGWELRQYCSGLPFAPGSEFDLNNIRVVGPDSVLVDGGCLGCGMGSSLIGLLDIGIGNPGLWGQVLDTSMNLGPPPTNGCTLLAPGGNYSIGPRAVPLFQPDMANALTNAFKDLNSKEIVPTIDSGYRNPADQLRMRNGASGPNPAAAVSWHEAGMAVDINGTASSYFPIIVGAMQRQGLIWGGTFIHRDLPHFQLPPAGTSPSAVMVTACGGHR
jgi:RHS repeat-associated protein